MSMIPSGSTVFIMELAFSVIFSFLFFLLGLHEGIFEKKGNYTRAIIFHIVSLPFCVLTIGMVLGSGESFALAFRWGFTFFAFLDFLLVVFNGIRMFTVYEEEKPDRNKRWSREGNERR